MSTERRSARFGAAALVAAVHALLLLALLVGLGPRVRQQVADTLQVFDVVSAPVPPQPLPQPARQAAPEEEGAASPPNIRAAPTPVTAPPPQVPLPVRSPVDAADRSSPAEGRDLTAGNAEVPGPGTGSGGLGEGTGSGTGGLGAGGGGAAVSAQRESGGIADSDYPRAALQAGREGTVSVRFTVRTDGRVRGCRVTRSSGHPDLDATTCRLIERRFRYRPARNAGGEPVEEEVSRTFDWLLPYRRGLMRDEP